MSKENNGSIGDKVFEILDGLRAKGLEGDAKAILEAFNSIKNQEYVEIVEEINGRQFKNVVKRT